MEDIYEQLMTAVAEDDVEKARDLIATGVDLNHRCDQGASVLYGAILYGNPIIVREMLEHGADPNLVAYEPAANIYADKPLHVARQARFLMDWDKFDPIVRLLEAFGARDTDGRLPSKDPPEVETEAREWQARKRVQSNSV